VQRTHFGTGAPEDGYALPFWWRHRGRLKDFPAQEFYIFTFTRSSRSPRPDPN
jgi:hypothetical protein